MLTNLFPHSPNLFKIIMFELFKLIEQTVDDAACLYERTVGFS
ncbi:hypothetical protein CHCC14568_2875 [Bacillus licheniformis]|nr:hypothetical protein CHCC14568_2875 [Bacillus licheniformis]TWN64398.1 hypothetical protein CHCC14437_3686 [Bacillus licheniformis]